jgi:protein-tyrosine phosphatase
MRQPLPILERVVMPGHGIDPLPLVEGRDGPCRLRLGGLPGGEGVVVCPSFSGERIIGGLAPVAARASEILIELEPSTVRHYFHCLEAGGKTTVVAERCLAVDGVTNFRDLGGYRSRDGRRVKWGSLYRSARLSDMSAAGRRYFENLGIGLICDFRRRSERQSESDHLGPSACQVAGLGIDPGSIIDFFADYRAGVLLPGQLVAMMNNIYRELVREHGSRYRKMFELILSRPSGATLIHCSAGKDRTGVAAAMILAALDVPAETIVDDYLLTNRYYAIEAETRRFCDKNGITCSGEIFRPLMEVREEYLASAFAVIEEEFGGLDQYLADVLGINEERRELLRSRYLV